VGEESRRDLGGVALGEVAFGEDVVEGDITRGGEERSTGEDTRTVDVDSEMETAERSLSEDRTEAEDGVDMAAST